MKSLNELGSLYHQYDIKSELLRSSNDILIHITSEIGECFTAIRNYEPKLYPGENGKPEGLGPELADIVILTAKLAAYHGIDLEKMIELKHDFNLTRLPKAATE